MPVWAAIVLPAIGFVWAAWLMINWLDNLKARRDALERFEWWMNQPRPYDQEADR